MWLHGLLKFQQGEELPQLDSIPLGHRRYGEWLRLGQIKPALQGHLRYLRPRKALFRDLLVYLHGQNVSQRKVTYCTVETCPPFEHLGFADIVASPQLEVHLQY